MMIPHLVPELPQEQKNALRELIKAPLVYSTVLLRNWRAIKQLGLGAAERPGSLHQLVLLDYPVKLGNYSFSDHPDQPMVLTMAHVPLADHHGIPRKNSFDKAVSSSSVCPLRILRPQSRSILEARRDREDLNRNGIFRPSL